MKLKISPKRKAPSGTDLTALQMRNPAVSNIVLKCLGPDGMAPVGMTPKERQDEWLKQYRGLPENPTLDELQECYRKCPATSLPEAGELLERMRRLQRTPPRPQP